MSAAFMPHGHCYLWTPLILWLHVGSDALTALAYYSIPLALAVLVRRRNDIPFGFTFVMFGAFIFLCGTTHLMNVWTTWHPDYLAEGILKAAMAIVSVATAVVLWPLLPRAIALPSSEDLRRSNLALEAEVERRRGIESELRDAADRLAERSRELERSNEALTRFAHVASHDLREPLRSVSSFSELLERECADQLGEEPRSWLSFVQRDALRMQTLVDELLDLARHQRRALELESIPFGELCDELLGSLSALREEKGGEVVVEGAEPELVADRPMLFQAIQNLVSNALKYADRPRIRIALEDRDDHWSVSVADNGPGIDPLFRDRIFEAFHRLSHDTAGTGIGLSIVRETAERHGGRVSVTDAPGGGSVFRLDLPKEET